MVTDLFFAKEVSYELLKELGTLCRKACFFNRQSAGQLKMSLEQLLPIIQEIQDAGVELPQTRLSQLRQLSDKLRHGVQLVQKASDSSRWNVYSNLQLSKKMEKLEKSVSKFLNGPMQAHILADVHHIRVECAERFDRLENFAKRFEQRLGNVKVGQDRVGYLEELMKRAEEEREGFDSGCTLGNGIKVGKEKVKEILTCKEDLSVVGIWGIGGSGKTTLAKEICRDKQIKSFFNRIIFETVSQSPNVEHLKQNILEQLLGTSSTNPYESIPQWRIRFEQMTRGPTLVVLDDVWSISQLEQLIFNLPGCKILVVSRFQFPEIIKSSYEVELLKEEEALSLFCQSAFHQDSIPVAANKKLVKQVVEECKGLPLALKVIGASLRGQPPLIWESAKNKLSKGEPISEFHEVKLLERMAVSVDRLSSRVRECFLDLGSFLEDRKIPLDVLINIWLETHDLDEVDAFSVLFELSDKNLLTLFKDSRVGDIYCSYNEISVTQHDILRDLALHINNRGSLSQRKRLIMPKRESGLPKDWLRNKDQPFTAQIVSIHTGEMKESDWFDMYFPNAEVLMLNFASNAYFLPPFTKKMPNLKCLVLLNYGNSTAVLHNLSVFSSLTDLKSLWLERITVPPLSRKTVPLSNLQKVSLVLCNLNESLNGSLGELPVIFPRLSEFTVDHSLDLKELPSSICEVQTLESLNLTNCHDLVGLPVQLGKLSSLQILRLYACPSLTKLPQTICGLKRLKYLDVSRCVNLRSLPEGIGQLDNLEKIDMRECSLIMDLPLSALSLKSLGHVICDEEVAIFWKEAEKMIPELRIEVAEERFTLDWLVE
ncbi:probable disease resistance protein At4g33300 [Aristolochia californica]|uniref:probable disease resistance protein At4g33300 n=1 Tax=Aristolochia californica TaxID=171875 RepID=UPI0035DAA767